MIKKIFGTKLINRPGFNLIELLVVLAIIGLLTTLSAAVVGRARDKSKIAAAQHDIDQIAKAIGMLMTDTGMWPGHQAVDVICSGVCGANEICGPDINSNTCAAGLDDGAAGILINDAVTPYSNWQGPYMPKMPLDPWGREFYFDTDYQVKLSDNTPCDGGVLGVDCRNAAAIGSYGPDGEGAPAGMAPGIYGGDDIIKILK